MVREDIHIFEVNIIGVLSTLHLKMQKQYLF